MLQTAARGGVESGSSPTRSATVRRAFRLVNGNVRQTGGGYALRRKGRLASRGLQALRFPQEIVVEADPPVARCVGWLPLVATAGVVA